MTAPAGRAEREGTLSEQLAERYAGFPAPIPAIIERTPMDEIIRTDLYDFLPLTRWWQGRGILLGDAAHAMTPNLGQGGAQAIEDAFLLAHKLSHCGSIREAFWEYERLRMPKVRRMVHTAWRYGQIAHIRRRWIQRLRNLVMQSVPDWVNQKRVEWLYALND
jgi:2-polyprenyl-6-methoxyphenol hydroxylase-like FAD-dependent oxidoreductase